MKYINESELSEALGVCRTTLWLLRKEGLPHLMVRGSRRFRLDEVEEWLRRRNADQQDGKAMPAPTKSTADQRGQICT